MQFVSTALYNQRFSASNLNEAIMIAVNRLEIESGGKVQLINADKEGEYAACIASITTKEKVFRDGEQVEEEVKDQRPFVVKPFSYLD